MKNRKLKSLSLAVLTLVMSVFCFGIYGAGAEAVTEQHLFDECDVIDFSDNIHNLGKQQAYMRFKEFWDSEDGMGVVEVVLITIVLVGLVVVFKKQITSLVNSILSKMTNQANKI